MSKYDSLWVRIQQDGRAQFKLTFDEIAQIAGLPLDHSFLTYKKELKEYGYEVSKISMREKAVSFNKIRYAQECTKKKTACFSLPFHSLAVSL